ncbi:MAG: Rieske 2Fe-2S domain-containing protein [Deltaproteobacteria bacterium]|nr:Rieske 2Fe-2S domain-containing protein [Deltaproteobacteria bacterium]
MLTKLQNELLCYTGPGTPCGEFLRRYWLPVGLSNEVAAGGKPMAVKVMGEDLVLFRDDQGRPGLLGLNCSHRLTSLAYGRVEDGGIRCPFHGWLYDVEGKCLEQPAEPDAMVKDKLRHPAYPCQELGGLIFAFLGPEEKMPLLPKYETLVREDGSRKVDYYHINSNYLQNVEGALDTSHASFLHIDNWSKMKHKLRTMPKREIQFKETDYGIWQTATSHIQADRRGELIPVYAHFFMPTGFMRIQENRFEKGLIQKFQSWYVPMDDSHTKRFQVAFSPLLGNGKAFEWPPPGDFIQPGPENDYFRNYEEVDTLSGIPLKTSQSNIKGFLCQDNMVNETQGQIVDRTQEHLGALDKVLTAMRVMMLLAIEDVQQGRDPKHILREKAKDEVVYIRGNEEQELA